MSLSKEQVIEIYKKNKSKTNIQVFHGGNQLWPHEHLLCTYQSNNIKKAVFYVDELNRETFKKFMQIKNSLGADKIVVYCQYAYYYSPDTLEIVLNRE